MRAGQFDDVTAQYRHPDPLQVRIHTHRMYQERVIDLDAEAEQLLDLDVRASLLDAGCGPGLFLRHLRRKGYRGRLAGLDQSEGMTAAARSEPLDVKGVTGDVTAIPFADSEFDYAVARHMLYHVPNVPAALSELNRVAARSWLVSTGSRKSMPYLMGLLAGVVSTFGMVPEEPVMQRFCTENAGALLREAGFAYRETLLDNGLIFKSAEPVAAYVLSCLPSYSIEEGSRLHAEMGEWLMERAKSDLAGNGGTILDPTRVGLYIVDQE